MSWSIFPSWKLSEEVKGRPMDTSPTTHKLQFSLSRESLWIHSTQSDRWEQFSNLKAWGKNTYSEMFPVLVWNYRALLVSTLSRLSCPEWCWQVWESPEINQEAETEGQGFTSQRRLSQDSDHACWLLSSSNTYVTNPYCILFLQ